jgi:hypothetical protein
MAGYNDAIDRFLNLRSADLQSTTAEAAKVASQASSDSFVVTQDGYNVIVNRVYPFSFAYLYDNPDNPSAPIVGPRSANFLITLQTPDLTKPVTNLVVTEGLLMYGVKWDLIDKALPANKWLIDIQIYESLTGAFAGEEYLVWNGNGNSASILVSNTANRWIRVDTRDQDYRKKSVVYGPFKASDPIVVDTVGPDNVSSVDTSVKGIDTSGYLGFNAYVNISWPAVTGNGIRGYRIRFSNDNNATYSYVDSPGTGTTYKLSGLAIGSTYKIAVATYDEYNNTSSNYISGPDVTVAGTPSVSNFISGGPFQFGVGVGSVSTNKGLYFDASNYWYVNATNSARLKVGGATDNYLLWDGAKFTVDGDISARGGTFTGNIFMSNPSGGKGASIYSGTIDAATGNLTGNGFALNSTGLKVANGSNSVTLSAATGAITANAGTIAGWNLSDTTLSKNNIVLNSAGTIQVGSSAASSVYLTSSGSFLMWAGNNTPDANAKFRVGTDGTLYASGAVLGSGTTLDGYATSNTVNNLGLRLTNVENNAVSSFTLSSGLATKNTTFVQGNNSGTPTALRVGDLWIDTDAGNEIKTWNGSSWTSRRDTTFARSVDLNSKLNASVFIVQSAIDNKITADANGLEIFSGTANSGLKFTGAGLFGYKNNVPTFSILSDGTASFSGNLSAATGTIGRVTAGTDNTSSWFDTGATLSGIAGISIGAIGFKNTSVGGWTSHCYPYMPGSPNIDLGTAQFRWNEVRASGSIMVGHNGTDGPSSVVSGTGPKIRLYPDGRIFADLLGTSTRVPGSSVTIVQDTSGFLRVYVAASSRKYKDNIMYKETESLYNLIKELKPVTFNYKPEFSDLPEQLHLGLIAEDVHAIQPDNDLMIYKNNEPDSVVYEKIPMLLVGAFKEMAKKIDTLQSRLDALEG